MTIHIPSNNRQVGEINFSNNTDVTSISNLNEWTVINVSNWDGNSSNYGFELHSDNKSLKYTYNTQKTVVCYLDAQILAATNNVDFEFGIFLNNVLQPLSVFSFNYKTIPIASSHIYVFKINKDDLMEMRVRNISDSTNVTVQHADITCWTTN